MSYWDETYRYLNSHGGCGPICPNCGDPMFPEDDHGRFTCFCDLGKSFDVTIGASIDVQRIPQVDASDMSDEEKAKIPPINRLNSTVTAAEAKFFKISARGPDAMDDPEYWAASKAVEEERKKAFENEKRE